MGSSGVAFLLFVDTLGDAPYAYLKFSLLQ